MLFRSAFIGPSYHIGWNVPYTGVGFILGGTLDYWVEGQPIGIRLFGNLHIIPGPGTTSDTPADDLGAFGNMGVGNVPIIVKWEANNGSNNRPGHTHAPNRNSGSGSGGGGSNDTRGDTIWYAYIRVWEIAY